MRMKRQHTLPAKNGSLVGSMPSKYSYASIAQQLLLVLPSIVHNKVLLQSPSHIWEAEACMLAYASTFSTHNHSLRKHSPTLSIFRQTVQSRRYEVSYRLLQSIHAC